MFLVLVTRIRIYMMLLIHRQLICLLCMHHTTCHNTGTLPSQPNPAKQSNTPSCYQPPPKISMLFCFCEDFTNINVVEFLHMTCWSLQYQHHGHTWSSCANIIHTCELLHFSIISIYIYIRIQGRLPVIAVFPTWKVCYHMLLQYNTTHNIQKFSCTLFLCPYVIRYSYVSSLLARIAHQHMQLDIKSS